MAWTPPKTWVRQDPLLAEEYNTQFRDNLNYLKGRQDDIAPKVNALYPGVYQSAKAHRAVLDMSTQRTVNSTTFARVHSTLGITFTPQTDEVLFSVQFAVYVTEHRTIHCGVWKDSAAYAFSFSSGNGSSDAAFYHRVRAGNNDDPRFQGSIQYVAPVSVVRNQQVSLYPSWKGNAVTLNETPMFLIVEEVGSYG